MMCRISVIIIILSIFSGCSGPAPIGRESLSAVEPQYRPSGQKPPLPALNSDSPLSDFITYAVLNNPEAEAAFYDWAEKMGVILTQTRLINILSPDLEDVIGARSFRVLA